MSVLRLLNKQAQSLKNEREIENNYKLQKEYLDERIEALKEYLRK